MQHFMSLMWRIALIFVLIECLPQTAEAQMFSVPSRDESSYGGGNALTAGYVLFDWTVTTKSGNTRTERLHFQNGRMYQLTYTSPNLLLSAGLATPEYCYAEEASCTFSLRDVHAISMSSIPLRQRTKLSLQIPVGIQFDYRKVGPEDRLNTPGYYYGITVPHLVTGLNGQLSVGQRGRLLLHALAGPGLVVETMDNGLGFGYSAEAGAELQIAKLLKRYGLSVGLDYRRHFWDVKFTGLKFDPTTEQTSYKGQQTGFRVGLLF